MRSVRRGLCGASSFLLRPEADVERRRLAATDLHFGDVRAIARLGNLNRVRTFGDVDHQAILRVGPAPFFAVDRHFGVGRLDTNGQRPVAGGLRPAARVARSLRRHRRRPSHWRASWRWLLRHWRRTFAWARRSRLRSRRRLRRLRPGFRLLARGEWLHRVLHVERFSRRNVQLLVHGAVAVEEQLDLVLAGRDAEPLEGAVEVVDDAGVKAVDVDLRFFRLDLETEGRARIDSIRAVRRVAVWAPRILIAVGKAVPGIEPERIVEVWSV